MSIAIDVDKEFDEAEHGMFIDGAITVVVHPVAGLDRVGVYIGGGVIAVACPVDVVHHVPARDDAGL